MYQVHHSATLDCSKGEALTDFSMPWSNRESPITSFRAVWNDDWLGFQFQVVDEDIVLFEGEDRDDSVLGSDRVELFFATDHELKDTTTESKWIPEVGFSILELAITGKLMIAGTFLR